MDVAIHPGLRCRRRIGPDVASIAVRQIQGKETGLLFNTADHDHCLAEIGLSMAWRVRQRNEHFAMPPTVLPYMVLDDGMAAVDSHARREAARKSAWPYAAACVVSPGLLKAIDR